MKVVFAEAQKEHDPQLCYASGALVPAAEVPERATRLLRAAQAAGLKRDRPHDYGLDWISKVHSERYLHYFEHIFTRWARIEGSSAEVIPGIQPGARDGTYPASAVAQAGWHHSDTASPITEFTWGSALWSAHTAAHAALKVIDGEDSCYALCRPPGHHASAEVAGGFCYLNNTAVCAEILRSLHARVAILDVDVHHGNGTQDIFYDRPDIFTISIHADPLRFYPFFWGHAEEHGTGDGLGYNFNLPLPRGTADDEYAAALNVALERIRTFNADALVVALGLDAYKGDPLSGLAITTSGFARIGEQIGMLRLPTVIVQEGGYLSSALGKNLSAFLDGFLKIHAD